MAYTIRRATPEDLPAIERITHSAYQPWVAVVGGRPGPMDEDYESLITNNGVHVATSDHVVAGVLLLDVVSDALVIRNVAVAPRHQGRGLGGQLLSFAEATADSRGLGMVRLFTHERMGTNIAWYQRHGYDVETTQQIEVGRLIHMRKSLHRDQDHLDASDGSRTPLSRSGPRPKVEFTAAQIVLFSRNIERATEFYTSAGFDEVFRTPTEGPPIHVDLVLAGYRIGLATESSTRNDHGLAPVAEGQRAAVILWTDDTTAGYARLQELGARPVKDPEPWLGRLLIAWVEDPDGHLIQIVQAVQGAGG